jgi:tetratricopeptide (TPR) repeat protein
MNRTCWIVCLVWGLAGVWARADDPKPQKAPKPPWQRLLTGADARQAADLKQRSAALEAADQYAEAVRLYEELLALRNTVQGADHWEAISAKWFLKTAQKLASVTVEQRAAWRRAWQGDSQAGLLQQRGQYAQALPLAQEFLNQCRLVLTEDYPETATSYGHLAFILQAQGRSAEAGPLYRRALDIERRAMGEDHPYTALCYHNLAGNLNAEGKYAEAGPLAQKALDINRQILGEDHPYTAHSYTSVANSLQGQGKYAEARPLCQKTLDIRRRVLGEDHRDTAGSYHACGRILWLQGRYSEAEALFRKALDLRRQILGENHPETVACYLGIAANLYSQERYAEAEPLYRRVQEICSQVLGEQHPYTPFSYNSLAASLYQQGRSAEAGPLFQKALDIHRKLVGEDHPDTALDYGNVALNLAAQRKHAEALLLHQKALDIHRKLVGEDHPDTVAGYNRIALCLQAQGKPAEALAALEQGARSFEAARLSVAAAGLERAAFGVERSPYRWLAAVRSELGRRTDAWAALEADLARGLLDEQSLRRGAGLTAAEQQQRQDALAQRTPLDRAIGALVNRPSHTPEEAAELQRLLQQRRTLEQTLDELAVAVSRREVASLAKLQAALPADTAWVAWVDGEDPSGRVQEHWGCVVRSQGKPRWERLAGSGPAGQWTKADSELPAQFRQALRRGVPAEEIDSLARKLHAQRLAPLARHLVGVRRLLVAPVHAMAGIPLETLTDQHTVSYTPSGTFLAHLKDRARPRSTRLLAVGDPLFPAAPLPASSIALPPGGLLISQVVPEGNAARARLQAGDVLVAYAGEEITSADQLDKLVAAQDGAKAVVVKVWREGQAQLAERELAPGRLGVLLAKEPARKAITARRQTDHLLAQLRRGDAYAELPGTQVELARLAALFDAPSVMTLTRAEATEAHLDALRQADQLKTYRYLHFATHGTANDVRAFDSALILTRPAKSPEPRVGEPYLEGRLTAAEVLEFWHLDAELVTLSACDSGLGRPGGGDGLLGFAQAFLLAGSRAVCLSLWQVDDTATALLMDRFYRNLLGKREDGAKPLGKAAALHEAKQWLRTLTARAALDRLGTLTQGVVRGERPAREAMHAVPQAKDAALDYRPYAHPRYWAAFILIGDPD